MSWRQGLQDPLPEFRLLTTQVTPPGLPLRKTGSNHPPAADVTRGDVKCLTSRAEIVLVNTGTPITPENNLLSLLATITANPAHKAWLFRVSFLLPFFTRTPAHTLPNNNYACWAQFMNPALFSVVTWEDPEIPVSNNDFTITGGEWLSPPPLLPMHTLDSPWTIDGPHLPFCITQQMHIYVLTPALSGI